MNENNTSDDAKGKKPSDGNKPQKKMPEPVIKGETKEVVVKGKIKLEDPVRVVGETDGPPVFVKVKDEPPLKMEVSNEIPLTVDVGKAPVNVNLTTNERPAGEFTAENFFMTIKNLPSYFARIFTNRKYSWTDYDELKVHVCEDIDAILPIDEEEFNKQFKFDAYRSLSLSGDVFNYLRGITMQHRWRIADIIYPPGLELIYNYWMDEGSVSQTLFAITERYRNRPGKWSENLRNFTLDPIRRINSLLMSYIRALRIGDLLTLEERSMEYQNQYGYFIPGNHSHGLEVRSNFHSAFNKLLSECARYFRQVDDKTRNADGFPVLSSLQELNIILATGDINQAVSFAKRARTEVCIEQHILGRTEIGEYLKERPMVPYKHDWMRRVDAMKSLQGWNQNSIRVFNDLAENGEIILLGARYIDWANIVDEDFAEAWAIFFRNEIQMYIHRYYSVTGVDLSLERVESSDARVRDILPAVLIRNRAVKRV